MTHAYDEDSKIHTVRSTVTEREAREGYSRHRAGEVERAQPSSSNEIQGGPQRLDINLLERIASWSFTNVEEIISLRMR